jgi:hypothetical protein
MHRSRRQPIKIGYFNQTVFTGLYAQQSTKNFRNLAELVRLAVVTTNLGS